MHHVAFLVNSSVTIPAAAARAAALVAAPKQHLLHLTNGDNIQDKQRNKQSDKKIAPCGDCLERRKKPELGLCELMLHDLLALSELFTLALLWLSHKRNSSVCHKPWSANPCPEIRDLVE